MNLTHLELQKLTPLSIKKDIHNTGGTIYIKDKDTLYKIFKDFNSYEYETERNIDFQIIHNIPNCSKIKDKIFIDNHFSGYSMEYKQDTLTFRDSINNNISFETKVNAICDVYQGLRYLHERNIYIGDIHSDNFLISSNGDGYIIDLETIRFPGDEYKFEQCYLIKPNNQKNKINIADAYTDNIKTMISSLTLLLEIDLEQLISKKTYDLNLEELQQKVILPLGNPALFKYVKDLMQTSKKEPFTYFDTFLKKYTNNESKNNYRLK